MSSLDTYIDLVVAAHELRPYPEYESHAEWIAAVREVGELADRLTERESSDDYRRGFNAGYSEAHREWQTSR